MGGGVAAWLATRELLLAGGTAVTGGIAGLMKRSDVRRAPCHTKITPVYTYLTEDTNPYEKLYRHRHKRTQTADKLFKVQILWLAHVQTGSNPSN